MNLPKNLVLNLIKDDLTHSRLLHELSNLGIDTTSRYLSLPDTIFSLMGFENNLSEEEIYEQYRSLIHYASGLDSQRFQNSIDLIASDIFDTLNQGKSYGQN